MSFIFLSVASIPGCDELWILSNHYLWKDLETYCPIFLVEISEKTLTLVPGLTILFNISEVFTLAIFVV